MEKKVRFLNKRFTNIIPEVVQRPKLYGQMMHIKRKYKEAAYSAYKNKTSYNTNYKMTNERPVYIFIIGQLKWRHTIQMINNRPVYILPLVN